MNNAAFGNTKFVCNLSVSNYFFILFKTLFVYFFVLIAAMVLTIGATLFVSQPDWIHSLPGFGVPYDEITNSSQLKIDQAQQNTLAALLTLLPILLFMYGAFIAFFVSVYTRIMNLVWQNTSVGNGHLFHCQIKTQKMVWIVLSNLFLTSITLGLYLPFAKVRTAKYRLSCMSVQSNGSVDHFLADQHMQVGSTGDGLSNVLGLDIQF